jgi:hypothetical protein
MIEKHLKTLKKKKELALKVIVTLSFKKVLRDFSLVFHVDYC